MISESRKVLFLSFSVFITQRPLSFVGIGRYSFPVRCLSLSQSSAEWSVDLLICGQEEEEEEEEKHALCSSPDERKCLNWLC